MMTWISIGHSWVLQNIAQVFIYSYTDKFGTFWVWNQLFLVRICPSLVSHYRSWVINYSSKSKFEPLRFQFTPLWLLITPLRFLEVFEMKFGWSGVKFIRHWMKLQTLQFKLFTHWFKREFGELVAQYWFPSTGFGNEAIGTQEYIQDNENQLQAEIYYGTR